MFQNMYTQKLAIVHFPRHSNSLVNSCWYVHFQRIRI